MSPDRAGSADASEARPIRTPAQVDGILPAAALVLTEEDVREIEAKAQRS